MPTNSPVQTEASAEPLSYYEQLKHPAWQKRRLEIMQRDNWQCLDCNTRDIQLHVHHCEYIRTLNLWDYPDDLLMTLCAECHAIRAQREAAIHVALAKILKQWPLDRLEEGAWWFIDKAQQEIGAPPFVL